MKLKESKKKFPLSDEQMIIMQLVLCVTAILVIIIALVLQLWL
ncbi:hypothetical protein [Parabacteroides johnsonii]|nr:hypothetical protein [Parabacteroides johnsonii]